MPVKNYKFRPVFIKTVIVLWLFAITASVSAQSLEQSTEKLSKQLTEKAETASDVEEPKLNAVSEKSEQQDEKYHIYRKEHPDNPCDRGLDAYDYEKKWYDDTQIYINSRFCEPALWFDNFFANDRIFDEGVAGTYVRWRNDFTYDEEESFEYKMRFNLSVELPGFQDRMRLTFEGDEDEDLRDIAPGNGDGTTNSLGLQLDLKETARSKFNVNVSLSPKIRFRYRYTYPIYKNVIMRLTQEVQRKEQINSARSLIDYEHTFKENFLFRSSTEGKVSEEFDGVDWLQAFVLYQRVNKKTSLSYEASVNGITEPWTLATNYRVGLRFRRNIHREWLFFEIAPEYTWPVTLDQPRLMIEKDRRSKWMIFFRLEVHFGNAYKKRYKDHN
jgi:hypothetical protein